MNIPSSFWPSSPTQHGNYLNTIFDGEDHTDKDDFLDLAEDEHHVDMAMCLANGQPQTASFTNQAPSSGSPGLVMKAESNGLVHGLGHTTASNHTTNNHHLVDNQVMKLDNLDNWDQDVLLSNAGLPETNPLLLDEDLDQTVGEDFQKMLNEWENHIGSLQSSDIPDVDMSTLVPTEVSTAVPPTSMSGTSCSGSTPGHHTLASSHSLVSTTISGYNSVPGTSVSGSVNSLINPVIKTEIEDDIDMPEYQDMQDMQDEEFSSAGSNLGSSSQANILRQPQPQLNLATVKDDRDGGTAKMTLGQMALAGIVISSGPGDHFETYEVPSTSASDSSTESTNLRSILRPHVHLQTPYHRPQQETQPPRLSRPINVPLGEAHEAAVLEASDADNLLEQFEEVSPDFDDDYSQNSSISGHFSTNTTSSNNQVQNGSPAGNSKNPRKTSNIFKAVQNHFAASVAANNESNSANGRCRRLPRIVPSQRIRDALPREIIERIKASSQKSRTIAIIEPVHPNNIGNSSDSNATGPKSESSTGNFNCFTEQKPEIRNQNQKNQNFGNNLNQNHNSHLNSAATSHIVQAASKPSIISRSHVIQPQQHHTRFAEAANSLNKSKHMRLFSSPATSNPQQVQISLDHDYCSSSAKMKRGQRSNLNSSISLQQTGNGNIANNVHHQNIISTSRPVIRLHQSSSSNQGGEKIFKMSEINTAAHQNSNHLTGINGNSNSHQNSNGNGNMVSKKPSTIVVSSPLTSSKSTVRVGAPEAVITMPIAVEVNNSISSSNLNQNQNQNQNQNSYNNMPLVSPLSSPARKDSGLESGEASDTSEMSQHAFASSAVSTLSSGSSSDLYSKVPNYLTNVSVSNNDSRSVTEQEESKSYDRLPAYVKGVPKRVGSTSTRTSTESSHEVIIQPPSPTVGQACTVVGADHRMRTRQMRSRSSSSNSSVGDHSSTEGTNKPDSISGRMTTRSRTTLTGPAVPSAVISSTVASVRRGGLSSSSSSSSSSSADVSSRTSRPHHQQKGGRSWRKPMTSTGSENQAAGNGNNGRESDRSRSPQDRGIRGPRVPTSGQQGPVSGGTRNQAGNPGNGKGLLLPQKQQRQVEERRVVYVGRIAEGTTRAEIRTRFEVFGPIEEISVHFRDRGDNYGFVTFDSKKDAFSAIEHGNDDTSYPKVDLCFGGRRAFCKEKYADLDSGGASRLDRGHRNNGTNSSSRSEQARSCSRNSPGGGQQDNSVEDFDSLLKQVRAGLRK